MKAAAAIASNVDVAIVRLTVTEVSNEACIMLRSTLMALCAVLALSGPSWAQNYDTKAEQALLLDHGSGTVLFAKNADERVPPASLAKLMTMEVVFDRIRSGRLQLDELVTISEKAWREGGANSGGSTMFAELGSQVPVEDLVRGVIIQSGNDASIALAEHIGGTEDVFARLMTERARALGMEDSTFRNSTGLPDPEQLVTMRDMVTLARHLFETYPEFYRLYSEDSFTWNGITQRNRNPLLGENLGADGLKTGYTEASGYALVASAVRDGDRLFLAMSGLDSIRERAQEARSLMSWGTRAFERRRLFEAEEVVGGARVYGGSSREVGLVAGGPVDIFLPLTDRNDLRASIVYDGPLQAPISKGQPVGVLQVRQGDRVTQETPLFAAEDVGSGALHQRALDAAQEALFSWF